MKWILFLIVAFAFCNVGRADSTHGIVLAPGETLVSVDGVAVKSVPPLLSRVLHPVRTIQTARMNRGIAVPIRIPVVRARTCTVNAHGFRVCR